MVYPLALFLALLVHAACTSTASPDFRDGDLIFHTSRSAQSEALKRAMGSKYTHMGVIFLKNGEPFVYEAVGPVKWTPVDEWIERGLDGRYVVKRLADAKKVLSPEAISELKRVGQKYRGKPYDLYFEWSDSRIYCSELVWKMYKKALNIEVGDLQRFRDFNLSDPLVAAKLKERFGDNVPSDELVISPASMFRSKALVMVHQQ